MKKIAAIGILLTAGVVGAAFVFQAAARRLVEPERLQVQMLGRAQGNEIELRWIPESGWIPNRGLVLYEIIGDRETKLATVAPDSRTLGTQEWITASQPLNAVRSVDQRSVEASTAEFAEVRKEAAAAITEKKGSPELAIQQRVQGSKAIQDLRAKRADVGRSASASPAGGRGAALRTQPPPRGAAIRPDAGAARRADVPAEPPKGDEAINNARDSFRLVALSDRNSAMQIGMGVTVRGGSDGVRYELRAGEGKDALVVGSIKRAEFKGPPPAPKAEQPVQLGQFKVGLNFAIAGNPSDYGMVTYNLYRLGSDSKMHHLNGENPIFASFDEAKDGSLISKVMTATDTTAPIGRVEYRIEAVDCFGQKSQMTSIQFVTQDVAVPLGTPTFVAQGPIESAGLAKQLRGENERVMVYWRAQTMADDEIDEKGEPKPNSGKSAFTYQVDRLDHEVENSRPTALSRGLAPGKPADLTKMTLGTFFKLYPEVFNFFENQAKATSGRSGGGTKVPEFDLESSTAAEFEKKYEALLFGRGQPRWIIYETQDTVPKDDRFYRYRLTCRLERSQRTGETTDTSPVGIPARVLPKEPIGIQIADRLAGTTTADFANIKGSATNVLKMQAEPGLSGPKGLIRADVRDSRKRGAEMLKERLVKEQAAVRANPGLARASLRSGSVAGGSPAAAGLASQPRTAASLPTGIPANYGRIVSLSWKAPSYATPLTYRVFRAVGTGFRTTTGLPTSRRLQRKFGKAMVAAPLARSAAAPRANAQTLTSVTRQQGSGRQSIKAAAMAGKIAAPVRGLALASLGRQYADEFEPVETEYVLLGETAPGETTFTDVVPRSQSTAYFYKVEPVNRWGAKGTISAAAKKRLQPSLTPSAPKLEAATPNADQTVTIVVMPNLIEEDVTAYEVYRVEGRLAVPPVSPPPAPAGPVRIRPAFGSAASVQAARAPANLAPALAQKQVAQAGGGRAVASSNAVAPQSASSELGIASMDSPATAYADHQKALAKGSSAKPTGEAARVMDIQNYTKVHTITVTPSDPGPLTFIDNTVEGGKSYIYRLVAVNTAALKSPESGLLDATVFKTDVPTPQLSGAPTLASNKVLFTLQVTAKDGVKAFSIERSVGTKPFRALGVIPASSLGVMTQFEDSAVRSGVSYRYQVRSIDYSGNVSKVPLEVTAVTP